MRSSAYECRLTETHHARRLRLLGSPPELVHSGPVVQGPHPYAEPRSKALSDLVCSTAQLGAYKYFIILCPEMQGAFLEEKYPKDFSPGTTDGLGLFMPCRRESPAPFPRLPACGPVSQSLLLFWSGDFLIHSGGGGLLWYQLCRFFFSFIFHLIPPDRP